MKIKNLITLAALVAAGLMLASCGSSVDAPVESSGLTVAEAESAVRAECAGPYDSVAECEECVDGVLHQMDQRVEMHDDHVSELQAIFSGGECRDGGISGEVPVCHIPPGNPDNAHTITVSPNAVRAHLAHGDFEGPCEGECDQISCEVAEAECGIIDDGCGGTVDCGGCEDPETCGGGGEPNVCDGAAPS